METEGGHGKYDCSLFLVRPTPKVHISELQSLAIVEALQCQQFNTWEEPSKAAARQGKTWHAAGV